MIPIKIIKKKKDGQVSSGSAGSSSSSTSTEYHNPALDWFYFDVAQNAVRCNYDLYSVGNVSAYGGGSDVPAPTINLNASQRAQLLALLNMIEIDTANNTITFNGVVYTPQNNP
jgi:hypothetical protein